MTIVNLTQHAATMAQRDEGVVEFDDPALVRELLTFSSRPSAREMYERAEKLADVVRHYDYAMVGGAPYFMPALERALFDRGVVPLYAFSRRVVEETVLPDGSVEKKTVFRHEGFVDPTDDEKPGDS